MSISESTVQKQSKNKGIIIVNHIIQLTNEVETLKDQKGDLVKELERIYEDDKDSAMTQSLCFDMISALEAKDTAITWLETQIKSKTTELNLCDPTNAVKLEEMKKDDWFSIQLNMHALKDWIISKIWEHKFEVANLDHTVCTQAMDEDPLAKFGGRVPPWLGNENIHKGICFMQEMVNCQEEIA
ncbi:hypothetical protein BS47DRAFT_1364031 [Hydnum rufescens UP504]|uniref:Uncharacterized protein n=1 Tax=Hydnum rufescens UP504 TaxID=1448309 RepID=A0A9P6DU26_9AGAM|nr:hypothetical protein BS47DRAFT_1364031 [Hydnum rufescens UP504]